MKRWRRWLLGLLLMAVLPALAGGREPCGSARIFPAAAVNLLVLPYRSSGPELHRASTSTGERLAALIQQEALFSMLKYQSVGATQLYSTPGDRCNVNDIIASVMRGRDAMRPGHGLVLIWGRIYEDGKDIFLQSYLRFLRPGAAATIAVPAVADKDGAPALAFEAAMPAYGVALAPRRLSSQDFAEIEARAARTLVLRPTPDDDAPSRPYASRPDEALSYWVIEQRGDWMKIASQNSGQSGWVRARMDDSAWSLRRLMPELAYLDAVIAYLRLHSDTDAAGARRYLNWMQQGYTQYEKAVGADAAREAQALMLALQGELSWQGMDGGAWNDQAGNAAKLFARARRLIPESAAARNLAAVTEPLLQSEGRLTDTAMADINKGLLGAIALDGSNKLALRNLQKLYLYAQTQQRPGIYDKVQLKERLSLLKHALATDEAN